MESGSGICKEDEEMELPPGFRFHPTDEELISCYLTPKVLNNRFSARAIGEVDLNKCEPWDLPSRAKMGENEWYFFCLRDRKYPTGLRTNRATEAGYWKATGKDKEIYKTKTLVGMKKTLVFYEGRAPKGEKTNWVMHEYRLEGKYSLYNLSKPNKNEWVICRIFKKSSGGKKTHISGLVRLSSFGGGDEYRRPSSALLPPLMETTSFHHVTCFSDQMEDHKANNNNNQDIIQSFNNNNINAVLSSNSNIINNNNNSVSFPFSRMVSSFHNFNQVPQGFGGLQFGDSVMGHDQQQQQSLLNLSVLRDNINNKAEFSQDTNDMAQTSYEDQNDPSSSVGPVDLDCLWNY